MQNKNNYPPSPSNFAATTQRLSSQQLFGHLREIAIEHKGEVYTLRITRNEKLILTK